MNQTLHRIVYCSKGCISGDEEEIRRELDQILASARRNNSRVGVTGALLYKWRTSLRRSSPMSATMKLP